MSSVSSFPAATAKRNIPRRVVPPVLDGPKTLRSATVLLVDSNDQRRGKLLRELSTIPATILPVKRFDAALLESHRIHVSAFIVDGREDASGAIDLLRRVMATQPLAVAVLIGVENSVEAMLAAVNEIGVYRVLTATAPMQAVREAALGALAVEKDRNANMRCNKSWARELLSQIAQVIPATTLARIEETGGSLPIDIIVREQTQQEP